VPRFADQAIPGNSAQTKSWTAPFHPTQINFAQTKRRSLGAGPLGDGSDGSLLGANTPASQPVMVNSASSERGFLFLQGLASWFFDRLGRALLARGHRVHRVNFNGGDRAFWHLSGAVDFCGREHEWL